jgi:UDP-N-acetyl-D-mannosaminuronate dehydrogenase
MNLNNSNIKIGILGNGEIGSSLYKVYKDHTNNVFIKDLIIDEGLQDSDVLNICIPYSEKFEEIVSNHILEIKPKLTIIHSTILPNTTKNIINQTNISQVVHSPVRGVHPNLYEGIKTFVKFIGSESQETAILAKQHFEFLDIKSEICKNSTTTELAKLLSTTYYGLCIAWHGEVLEMCNSLDLPFEEVMTRFNETYNEGYKILGKDNVIRPVLYPPDNKIGGHCVIPNTKLLNCMFDSEAIKLILKYS